MSLIIVYIGAVSILFMFVIMLINNQLFFLNDHAIRFVPLVGTLLFTIFNRVFSFGNNLIVTGQLRELYSNTN